MRQIQIEDAAALSLGPSSNTADTLARFERHSPLPLDTSIDIYRLVHRKGLTVPMLSTSVHMPSNIDKVSDHAKRINDSALPLPGRQARC